MSHSHKQSWLARQVKEWWGFGFPGVTEKWGPSVYKGEREQTLDWFVSYWSNEMFPKHVSKSEGAEAKFTNHKHFLRTHWTHWEFDISYKSHSHVLFVWPFMSPNFCRAIYLRPFRSSYLPFRPLPAPDPICQRSLLPLSSLCCYADGAGPGGHQHQKIDGQVQNKPDMDQRQAMRHPTHHIWHMGCEQMGLCQKQKGQPPHSPITDGFRDWGFWSRPLTWWKWFFTHKSFKFFSGLQWAPEYLQLKSRFFPCEFQWQISEISRLQRYLVVIFALTLTCNWHFGSISLFLWPHIWRRGIFQKITY